MQTAPSRWPRRLALATALLSIPLVLFGGSVTTLGAGMAVDGWLVAEGHFLVFFPVERWFRDTATFVEHTHRLFGVAVGLCAVATLASVWITRSGRAAAGWACFALGAVCLQGTLGGLRVLENSPELAFLHGALAQAVLALLCVSAFALSPRTERPSERPVRGLLTLSLATTTLVYGQVVVGAWYRHSLRGPLEARVDLQLTLHLVGAFVVLAAVLALAGRIATSPSDAWRRVPRRLVALLGTQVLLGLVAWVGYRPDRVGPLEWAVSVLHVLTSGLLLAQCAVVCLGAWRSRRTAERRALVPARAQWSAAP